MDNASLHELRADRGKHCDNERAGSEDEVRATAVEIAQSQVAKAGDTLRTIKARMYAPVVDLLRAKNNSLG